MSNRHEEELMKLRAERDELYERVALIVQKYEHEAKASEARIEELENILKTSSDLQDKLLVKALEREREIAKFLRNVLWSIYATPMTLEESVRLAKIAVDRYDSQNVTEDGALTCTHECECSNTFYGEPDTDYCLYCEAGDCECAIHGPDGVKNEQCNTCQKEL